MHVEQDEIGNGLPGYHERFGAVGGLDDADIGIFEREAYEIYDGRLVVYHEDGRHGTLRLPAPCQKGNRGVMRG